MNANEEKQLGSNLTGAAIPAKPGHQRDIAIEDYTSALLGDVHPTRRTSESQEDQNSQE
ncbi:hypothetical protein [Pedobacter sp. JY14-1]|uniref:hypothetical protein n=1 Tax=Pedobacter sp. JY14-1 TaxID=3034151 RepID=UPI0023E32314|nr:hypothetical protein [Pedobacter sp. JY14-1]